MKAIMKHLGLDIPEWRLHRRIHVGNDYQPEVQKCTIYIRGFDIDGTPVSFVKHAQVTLFGKTYNIPQEPFQLSFKLPELENYEVSLYFKLEFMGWYLEPPLEFGHKVNLKQPSKVAYHLEYNPFRREWKIYDEKADRVNLTVQELKKKLSEQGIDYSGAIEKEDLLKLFDREAQTCD